MLVFFCLGTFKCRGVVDAPMRGNRRSGKDRTSLPGIVREGDDKVEITIGELVPGIPHGTDRINLKVLAKDFQDERMRFACGGLPGAVNFKAIPSEGAKDKFRENAAIRVARAEKQNTKGRVHNGELFTDKRGRTGSPCQSCDKIVTILPLALSQLIG